MVALEQIRSADTIVYTPGDITRTLGVPMARYLFATTLALLILASAHAVNGRFEVKDYQKIANDLPWTWSDEKATRDYCVKKYLSDYRLEVVDHRARILDGRTVVCTLGECSLFAACGEKLFVAEFHPSSSGCQVVAYDLRTWKQVWKTDLEGIGPVEHSKYRNHVNIETDGKTVTVWGNELMGQYVEILGARSGKMLGHKCYSRRGR
jgi:hypothetical protein